MQKFGGKSRRYKNDNRIELNEEIREKSLAHGQWPSTYVRTSIYLSDKKRSSKWSCSTHTHTHTRLPSFGFISLCPTTVISSNPHKLGGEIPGDGPLWEWNWKFELSKIIHRISRRDYVEEYNSMEFKNVEMLGNECTFGRKEKNCETFQLFFLISKYPWNSFSSPVLLGCSSSRVC